MAVKTSTEVGVTADAGQVFPEGELQRLAREAAAKKNKALGSYLRAEDAIVSGVRRVTYIFSVK